MKKQTLRDYIAVHSWVGIVCGLFLFIAFYAGAFSMLDPAITRWTQASHPQAAVSPDADAALDRFLAEHPDAKGRLSLRLANDQQTAPQAEQQAISTDVLVSILHDCIRNAEQAIITDREYLELMGFPAPRCEARELWQHLIASIIPKQTPQSQIWQEALTTQLEQGPLARRILQAVNLDFSPARLETVYRELCDCLEDGRMFSGISKK